MTDTIGRTAAGHRARVEAGDSSSGSKFYRVLSPGAAVLDGGAQPRRRWIRRYVALLLAADVAAGLIATAAAYFVRPTASLQTHYLGDSASYPRLAIVLLASWIAMLAWSGAYRSRHIVADHRTYRVPVVSAARLMALLIIASYVVSATTSRLMVLMYAVTLVASVLVARGAVNGVLQLARNRGRAQARILLVGETRAVRDFANHLLSRPDPGTQVVGVCTSTSEEYVWVRGHQFPVLGCPDDFVAVAQSVAADAVAVTEPTGLEDLSLQRATWELERSEIDLLLAPDAVSVAGPRIEVSVLRGLPLMHVRHPQHESLLRSAHHLLFRLLGSLIAVAVFPFFLLIALAIKLDSRGPVFFKQKRVGLKAQEFEMVKFRTMVPDAEARLSTLLDLNEHDGALFKMRNDPRVTRVGRFLRKYSLDELPQLLNVVKGDMTLVGPRPVLQREISRFGEEEHRRFMVLPGMTGLWQISGGPTLPWAEAVKTDLYYVDNWHPALDLGILAKTLRVVLTGKGI